MDKAEYRIATEHIKKLIAQGEYAEASHIADTIDWSRVKSVMMLCTVSDLYKINRRYQDAKEILYMAYERNPESRTILYSLCDLSIKLEEFVAAIEYYKSFVEVAPKDTGRYVLQYRLYQAQDVSLEERIEVLEQLKSEEYTEKWAYELAYLYHRIGFATKCVEECEELILWFGTGRYVYKAMELKMLHEPLTPSQQRVYDKRFEHLEQAKDMTRVLPRIDSGDSEMTDESMVDVTDAPTVEIPKEYIEKELQAESEEIQVKTLDVASAYNTINLQKELADSLREILDAPATEAKAAEAKEDEELVIPTIAVPEERAGGVVVEDLTAAVEEAMVDKQITGQLSIEDILTEWDKQSEEAKKAHEEEVSNRIKSQTQDIFAAIEAEKQKDLALDEVEDLSGEENIADEIENALEIASDDYEAEQEEAQAEEEPEELPEEAAEVEPEAELQLEALTEAVTEEKQSAAASVAQELDEAVNGLEEAEPYKVSFDRYADFVRDELTKRQITKALSKASAEPLSGNIAVTGHDLSVCFDFIRLFMSDLKKQGFSIAGKTAKISAVNLNKKEPSEIIKKVEGGVLIIERVGRLRKETVYKIVECLEQEMQSVLLFATDTDQGMNRFAERYPELAKFIDTRVDIKEYSSEELVEYAIKYAYQREYAIDTMGVLALRTNIDDMISNDDAPTITDAENIIEAAIERAKRKTFKHFLDVLLRRRYDEEDMIILKEAHFL